MNNLELKIKIFLEIVLKKIENNYIPIFELETILKNAFNNIDDNSDILIKEAKKEFEETDFSKINIENIEELVKINQYFNVIYNFIKSTYNNKIIKFEPTNTTFAFPTTVNMLALLPMFSGTPKMLSTSIQKLLEKNKEERTEEEQGEIDIFVEKVFDIEKNISYFDGKEYVTEIGRVLICDTPIISAKANAPENFISRREDLVTYIKRAYGAEGLRHFLALIIGLDENGRSGSFKLSMNKHLERLGYKKEESGSYNIEVKKMAAEIIYILSSLYVTIIKKKGDKKTIEGLKLFNLEGFTLDTDKNELIHKEFILSTTEWYKDAFLNTQKESFKYTKMLKIIAHENHLHHSLTIYLTTILSIFWRMNKTFSKKVQELMEWCNIEIYGSKNRLRDIKKIENELNYMKEKNYIGNWEIKDRKILLSECEDPLKETLIIYPPNWLNENFKPIEEKKAEIKKIEEKDILTLEEFLDIFKKSNLKIKDFCEKIDMSTRMFHLIKNKERKISPKIYENIRKAFC